MIIEPFDHICFYCGYPIHGVGCMYMNDDSVIRRIIYICPKCFNIHHVKEINIPELGDGLKPVNKVYTLYKGLSYYHWVD